MAKTLRKSGMPALGEFPWGLHFCHFFESTHGQIDAAIPFLLAGLEDGEACLWIVEDPRLEAAKHSIQRAISASATHLNPDAVEVLPTSQWYLHGGVFDPQRVVNAWKTKLEQALAQGFEGLRVVADASWVAARDLETFVRYEEEVDKLFTNLKVVVMCCHLLPRQTSASVLDLCHSHRFSIGQGGGGRMLFRERPRTGVGEDSSAHRGAGRGDGFNGAPDVDRVRFEGSLPDRPGRDSELHDHLWFLEGLDRANRAMQGTSDFEQVAADVVEATLSIFDCDRAWLLYPCEPAADSWKVVTGHSRPPFPISGMPVAMNEEMATAVRIVRDAAGPVTFGPESDFPLPPKTSRHFGVRSAIATAIRPKLGKPYAFGLHQCSRSRLWTTQEKRLFEAIGRRLTDTLTSLLVFRDLRASEARFRTFVDHATDAFFLHDDQGKIVDANRQACESLLYSREELIGMSPGDLDPEAADLRGQVEDRLKTGDVVFQSRHTRKDGTTFPVEVRIRRFEEGGRFLSVSLCHDISERQLAEQALLESHTLLKAVVEGTPDIVYVKDREGRYLMVNSAGARFLGEKPEAVVGKDDSELLMPEAARSIQEVDRRVMESGESQVIEESLVVRGSARTFLSTRSVYRDSKGEVIGLVGISRDITELKGLEEQLLEARKMESVARLAGGIAHEFNNLLTVINGQSELLLNRPGADDSTRQVASDILQAGERATKLVGQLLAFGRKQMLQPSTVNLNAMLPYLIKLVSQAVGAEVQIIVVPAPNLGLVKVDPTQLEQAIVNLLINAGDSLPQGGRITIETRNTELDSTYAKRHPGVVPGSYVQLSVSDSGPGMDSATLEHIFEPFFSSKHQRSGLSLAMVYGFVRQSEGHVRVSSELGGGTTFEVYLPRVGAAPRDEPGTARSVDHHASPKTILVVEDEEAVRVLVVHVLTSNGYAVLEARDGNEALTKARDHEGPIDLLLSDLVLPGQDGRQVADALTQTRAGLRVLFMSGYAPEEVVSRGVRGAGMSFLKKPFSPTALIDAVRGALGPGR